jgi:hypothetical protein
MGSVSNDALAMKTVFGYGSSTISAGTSSRLAWLTSTIAGPRDGSRSAPCSSSR